MPNWCSNSIVIEGPRQQILDLWNRSQSINESSNGPMGLLEAMVPLGEWNYEQAVSRWGTKWDLDTDGLEFIGSIGGERAAIIGHADSAWSPPIEAFEEFARDPNNTECYLEIGYFEPGMSFIGYWNSIEGDRCWEDVLEVVKRAQLVNESQVDNKLEELIEEFDLYNFYAEEID